jgi:hypothetical protein
LKLDENLLIYVSNMVNKFFYKNKRDRIVDIITGILPHTPKDIFDLHCKLIDLHTDKQINLEDGIIINWN